MTAMERIEQFERESGSLKFECIDKDKREEFTKSLKARMGNPRLINQGNTPLCGPAAFMHCVIKDKRDDYVHYVLDLAEKGEGRLGGLRVKPSNACLNASNSNRKGIGNIAPVDWVALASLKDSSNRLWRMKHQASEVAGITTGAALASWFNETGWFDAVNLSFYRSLNNQPRFRHLLDMNQRADGHICLLIRSAIITNHSSTDTGFKKWNGSGTPKTYLGTPDHWIVLDGRASVGQKEYQGAANLNLDELINKPLRFKFWTWGDGKVVEGKSCCAIDDRVSNITPASFLPYYYGYVSASKK